MPRTESHSSTWQSEHQNPTDCPITLNVTTQSSEQNHPPNHYWTLGLSYHTGLENFRVKGSKSGWRREVGHEMYPFLPGSVASRSAGLASRTRLHMSTVPKKTGVSTKASGFVAIRTCITRSFSHSLAWGVRPEGGPPIPEAQDGRQAIWRSLTMEVVHLPQERLLNLTDSGKWNNLCLTII